MYSKLALLPRVGGLRGATLQQQTDRDREFLRDSRPQVLVSSAQGEMVYWGMELKMVLPEEAERLGPSINPQDRAS